MLDKGSLSGIKVIDLSRLLPGPYCSMILADHGAQVIAVEDKRYLTAGHYIPDINRNKQHITLNLKSEEGKMIFFMLVEDADIIIESFRPGAVKRLGIDYDSVRRANPEIIYCSITGYGQTGPLKDKAGHDVNYMSMSGVLDQIGNAGGLPTIPGTQFADIAGGGMNGAIGILLALASKERTGKGQYVDISMTDSMVGFMPIVHFLKQVTGAFPDRSEGMLSHRYACYNIYETSDNKYMSVGAVEPQFWSELCGQLDLPECIPLQYDESHRHEVIETLRKKFLTKTRSQWEEKLSCLDTCCEAVLSPEEVLNVPHFLERKTVITTKEENGSEKTLLGVPIKMSRTPGEIRTPPVKFGESTMTVLGDLGFSESEIKGFAEKGVI